MSKATAASLTPKEMQLLAAAWMSCSVPPKPDYENVAEICGYKNASVASVMFTNLKRKLAKAAADSVGSGDAATTPTKPSPAKKRAASAEDGEATPKKRGRKPKAKDESGVKKDVDGDGDGDETVDFNDLLDPQNF